jgi:hypothetical protein
LYWNFIIRTTWAVGELRESIQAPERLLSQLPADHTHSQIPRRIRLGTLQAAVHQVYAQRNIRNCATY